MAGRPLGRPRGGRPPGPSVDPTITHFEPHFLECVNNAAFSCEKVTTSPESYVFGIPVVILGLAFYTVMTALCSPWAWRAG